jgi:hypothetical protein
MADTSQKTVTIDDLVNELSKKGPTTSPAGAPSGQTPVRPPVNPAPQSQPATSAPQFQQPRPASPPSAPPPSFKPPVSQQPAMAQRPPQPPAQSQPAPQNIKEYQSSIRTMASDVGNVKTGKDISSGVPIPRTVENRPQVAMPASPQAGSQIGQSSGQQPSSVTITLGEKQRAANLNPLAQKPTSPNQDNKPQPQTTIVVPEGYASSSKNIIFAGIAALVVLGGAAYWFFVLREPADIPIIPTTSPRVSVSSSPSITPTPTPQVILETVLAGSSKKITFGTTGDPLAIFQKGVKEEKIANGLIEKLLVSQTIGSESRQFTLSESLSKMLITYPASMSSAFSGKNALMAIYSQKEQFDKAGVLIPNATPVNRLIILSEIVDPIKVKANMKSWETNIASDFNSLFELGYKKGAVVAFLDNIYKGNSIRYVNFPYPDKSIDYAVVAAANKKTYLVITNSRESMYSVINQLSELNSLSRPTGAN